jgi:hypothetical protein
MQSPVYAHLPVFRLQIATSCRKSHATVVSRSITEIDARTFEAEKASTMGDHAGQDPRDRFLFRGTPSSNPVTTAAGRSHRLTFEDSAKKRSWTNCESETLGWLPPNHRSVGKAQPH